jgi:prepilin-type processing-associated H-X9-DG protein
VQNVRTIATAYLQYAADNQGILPASQAQDSQGRYPNNGFPKSQLSSGGFLTDDKVWECPALKTHFIWGDYGPNTALLPASAVDNRNLVRLASIERPSSQVMLGDAATMRNGQYEGAWNINGRTWAQAGGSGIGPGMLLPYPARHGQSMVFAYFDGHVEAVNVVVMGSPDQADARAKAFLNE